MIITYGLAFDIALVLIYLLFLGYMIAIVHCSGALNHDICERKEFIGLGNFYGFWCIFGAGLWVYLKPVPPPLNLEYAIAFTAWCAFSGWFGQTVVSNKAVKRLLLKFIAKKFGLHVSQEDLNTIEDAGKADKKDDIADLFNTGEFTAEEIQQMLKAERSKRESSNLKKNDETRVN